MLASNEASHDSERETSPFAMKNKLIELGLWEDGMGEEDMKELLEAIWNSKFSADEEDKKRQKEKEAKLNMDVKAGKSKSVCEGGMLRQYRNATERRLPWCLLPPDLLPMQRANCLAAYLQYLSIHRYMRARSQQCFAQWAEPITIISDQSKNARALRSTRSGRSAPSYVHLDLSDDESQSEKAKKRKTTLPITQASHSQRMLSLKRKLTDKGDTKADEEPIASEKEIKLELVDLVNVASSSSSSQKVLSVDTKSNNSTSCVLDLTSNDESESSFIVKPKAMKLKLSRQT